MHFPNQGAPASYSSVVDMALLQAAIFIKVTPFWSFDPTLWFTHVEDPPSPEQTSHTFDELLSTDALSFNLVRKALYCCPHCNAFYYTSESRKKHPQ